MTRISDEKISSVLCSALRKNSITQENDTSLIFYDLTHLTARIEELVGLFPESTLHAIAVKANPLISILTKFNKPEVGLEAASLPELHLALEAGYPPERIVFDSPVKTIEEIDFALDLGVYINANSIFELERIDNRLRDKPSNSLIGIRINPQIGEGNIPATSVAGEYSKFGVPIKHRRQELIDAFLRYEWLTGVHVHIGSQGCSPDMLLKGIEIVYDFADEVNRSMSGKDMSRKIEFFDIGGGLPVAYHSDRKVISMKEYGKAIEMKFPKLFSGGYRVITEFGRYIHANAGWTASRVEYVEKGPEVSTAYIHVGADLLLRRCYRPEDWYHEISVLDRKGKIKKKEGTGKYNIAGPLCFAGDIIAQDIELKLIEPGDYIIIHDTGAYTLSMWSRYNSRQIPKVVGYYNHGERFEILKERESIEWICKFWR